MATKENCERKNEKGFEKRIRVQEKPAEGERGHVGFGLLVLPSVGLTQGFSK